MTAPGGTPKPGDRPSAWLEDTHGSAKNSYLQMPQITLTTVQHVKVHKHLVARILTNYYWLLVPVSLLLFLYSAPRTPLFIELSFYPLYFLVGHLVKHFLQTRIPSLFSELHQTGALREEALPRLVEDLQRRLNSRLGDILGMVGGLSIVGFYFSLMSRPTGHVGYLASILVAVIDVLLAYALGVATWKAIVTALEIRRLGLTGLLRIHPFHPDGCAGLGAIGRFCFSLSLILISIGLFLSGWILYGRINDTVNGGYQGFEPWFIGGFIVLTLVSLLAFFFPMMTVHRLMKEQAANFEAQLAALGARISALEESLLSQGSQLGHEQLEAQDKEIQALRNTYTQRRKIPTWPIDWQTFTKFLSAQILLSVGFLSSVLSLWEKGWSLWEKGHKLSGS
jgi:hypothetical protein